MKEYPIIGIIGMHYAGSRAMSQHAGKDEFCTAFTQAMFAEGYRVTRRGFADPVKEDLARMLGVTVEYINANKKHFRRMMQGYGTDYARELLGADIWVKRMDSWLEQNAQVELALSRMDGLRFALAVSDCRLPNEVAYIKQQGGMVVRVTRHSTADYPIPADHAAHCSELVGELPFDYEIINTDLYAFRREVCRFTKKVYLPHYYANRRKLGVIYPEGQAVSGQREPSCASD